jgi:hypothetical protein
MHVPYEVFWHLNPRKLIPFQKAYEIEMESRQNATNLSSWLNGLYIQNAVASIFSKGAKYPQKPFDLFGVQKKSAEQEGMDFERYVQQFNARRKNQSITH